MEMAVGENKKYAGVIKAMRMGESIINTAVSVTKALKDYPGPMGVVMAGAYGAIGATQTAIIASQPMAEGGIVTSPQTRLIGERGAEAVIPLSKMRDMDSGGTTIIINAIDAKSFADVVRRNPQAIVSIVSENIKSNKSLRHEFKGMR